MEREINFRAKRRSFNQWIYFNLLDEINSYKEPSEFLQYHLDDKTIGQFTGLSDKNGKHIYEGDILINLEGKIGVVEFFNGSFCLKSNGYYVLNSGFLKNKEIIGNIYENPDLL